MSILTTPVIKCSPTISGVSWPLITGIFQLMFSQATARSPVQSWPPGASPCFEQAVESVSLFRAGSLSCLSFSIQPAHLSPPISWFVGPVFPGVHFVVFLLSYACACFWCFTLCCFCHLCAQLPKSKSTLESFFWAPVYSMSLLVFSLLKLEHLNMEQFYV